MAEYGGFGGIADGRPIDEGDPFEVMIARIFGERMRTDDELCTQIWSALANVTWLHLANKDSASYSFRAAGDMIAAIRGRGQYMDWYCSGPYATVTEEIRRSLRKEGWIPDDSTEICDEPGCLKDAGCGWPTENGDYRWTCADHYKGKIL